MNRLTALGIVAVLLLASGRTHAEDAPKNDARSQWIAERIERLAGSPDERDAAIKELLARDREGDCTDALIAVLPDYKRDVPVLEALIRALGINRLRTAALPITDFLSHKEPSIRANAAVSLEYIGSQDPKVVSALKKAAGREKDVAIANHVYRALGRCGLQDAKACAQLLKAAGSGKNEFATYGPTIGLAYFVADKRAVRGVEKILKALGVPGGRRGAGQNVVKRGLVSWTLASIGNEKSAVFVREEMIGKLENMKAFWVQPLADFWETVAQACEGDDSQLPAIEGGLRGFAAFAQRGGGDEVPSLMDASREGRSGGKFTPKGDGLLSGGEGR